MVEVTTAQTMKDIKAHGYTELGIFTEDSKHFGILLIEATIKNMYDLYLLQLNNDRDNLIYQVYKRSYK